MTETKGNTYGPGIPGFSEQPGNPYDENFGAMLAGELAEYKRARKNGELPAARIETMPLPRPGAKLSHMTEHGEAPARLR